MSKDEAIKKAKEYKPSMNHMVEHENAYEFYMETEEDFAGGPNMGFFILKDTGKIIRWSEYIMSDMFTDEVAEPIEV